MAKLLAPLLSHQAQGTLAKQVTYTGYKGLHIAKRIPTHIDARTLPQLYHRRLYYDAKEYWHSLTPTQQTAFITKAKGKNWTGYNQCIKDYLLAPLDLSLWLKMDKGWGNVAVDLSGKDNDGTIYGATWVPGKHLNALNFDGGDDSVKILNDPTLEPSQAMTIELWLNTDLSQSGWLLAKLDGWDGYNIVIPVSGNVEITVGNSDVSASYTVTAAAVITANLWHHVAFRAKLNEKLAILADGVLYEGDVLANPITPATQDLYFGRRSTGASDWWKGIADYVHLYTRALSFEQIRQHYERGV